MDYNFNNIEKKIKHHQFSRTHITDKRVDKLKKEVGWNGMGTAENPIAIDILTGLEPNIWIHQISSYIIVKSVSIYKLVCQNIQNIIIENCKIERLEIEGCFDIHVRNCEIDELKMQFSRKCIFENNMISSSSLHRLQNNFYDRIIPSVITILEILILIFLTLAGTFLIFLTPLYYITSPLLIILSLLIGILIFKFLSQKRRTKSMPANVLSGNQLLINPKALYHEILENYRYLPNKWFIYNLPIFIGIIGGVIVVVTIMYFLGIFPF